MSNSMTYGDIQKTTPEEERKYYVYMWWREINGEVTPVYVGMGSGNRWKTISGRGTTGEYLKKYKCQSQILVNNLALVVACVLEEEIKIAMVKRGAILLDGEHDANHRKQRQREGIDAMTTDTMGRKISKKTGNPYGRQPKETPDLEKFLKKQKDGHLTVKECCEQLGISRSVWYDRTRMIEM